MERLAALAPPGALRAAALRGNWRTVTRPEFPGGRGFDGEGRPLYTLGRATFGVLAPEATLVAFEGVENPVGGQEMHRDGAGEGEISYDIRVPLLVADGPAAGLRGELWTYGLCAPASAGAGADASGSVSLAAPRVPVRFVGGGLRYAGDGAVPVAWEDAFGASAVARDRAERSLLARVSSWAAKLMFGIETNSAGGASESGTPALLQSYAMRRAPQGYFDVLFLDDEIRVTRGNRGSLVVVERFECHGVRYKLCYVFTANAQGSSANSSALSKPASICWRRGTGPAPPRTAWRPCGPCGGCCARSTAP